MNYLFFWKLINILNDTQYNVVLFLFLFLFLLPTKLKYLNYIKLFSLLFFLKLDVNNIYYFINNYWNINNVLTNSLSLIHPLFVYILYINTIWMFTNNFINFFNFKLKLLNSIRIVFIALILGSWWAQQELNWGGWWNWDFIELILFIFFIKYIIYIHICTYKYKYFLKFTKNNLLLYLIIFFLFVRWDVLNSVHSFNSLNFLENYINYVLFFLVLYISLYTLLKYLSICNYCIIYNKKKILKINYVNTVFNSFVYFILSFYYYNIYCVIFYETDMLELACYLRLLLIFLILIGILLFLNYKKFNFLFLLFIFIINMLNFNLILIIVILYTYIFFKSYIYIHFVSLVLILYVYISNMFISYYFILPKHDFTFNFFLSIDCFRITVDSLKSMYNYNIHNTPLYIFIEDFLTFFNLQTFKYILFFNSQTNFLQNLQISNISQLNIILSNINIYGILYFCIFVVLISIKIKKYKIKI